MAILWIHLEQLYFLWIDVRQFYCCASCQAEWFFSFLLKQAEAVAFPCICGFLCFPCSISWSVDRRFAGDNWSFSLDRNCWCLAMCICVNQVSVCLQPLYFNLLVKLHYKYLYSWKFHLIWDIRHWFGWN